MQAGIAKYPLLALPMFVLVGSIFDRSGVAQRLVRLRQSPASAARRGMLPMVAILVAMVLGGISGSGPANAAAVGGVMIAAMARAGYPPPFSASIVGAAAATDILIPPSIAFIVYSVIGARRVGAGAVRRRHDPGRAGRAGADRAGGVAVAPARLRRAERDLPRPPFWRTLREAVVGAGGAGADPRRHARRLVHADRGGRGGGGLRPVRRHGDPPHASAAARPVRASSARPPRSRR